MIPQQMIEYLASDYLAKIVARYIDNKYPLEFLTGIDAQGQPDKDEIEMLRESLVAKGFAEIAKELPS